MERAFELLLRSDEGFNATELVNTLKAAVLRVVHSRNKALKYSEIGRELGLNETCVSQTRFKDAMIMVVCEDLVEKGYLKVSETVGWPYVEGVYNM